MKAEYINPFLMSTISTFDTMLNCKLERGTPYLKTATTPRHEVSGIIGLSGKAMGMVVLGLTGKTALNAAGALLQEPQTELNGDVTDAIGELVNIVAGSAKAKLEHLHMSVSLPTVITGCNHCAEFPRRVTPICIPFSSKWGDLTVEVGLIEDPPM